VEAIDLTSWSDRVVVPVAVTASVALPMLAVFMWRQHCRQEAVLATMLFLLLVGNATICGVISSPNDRYQARLVWLAPLAIGLTIQSWMSRRRVESKRPVAVPIQSATKLSDIAQASSHRHWRGVRHRDYSIFAATFNQQWCFWAADRHRAERRQRIGSSLGCNSTLLATFRRKI